MTWQIGFLLALIVVAMVFFATEWVEADVTALGLLIALAVTGLLPIDRAFAGFGSDTVIMILGLFILTAALMRTGVMDLTGRFILRHTGTNPTQLQIVVMVASAGLGAFMSNTASTAFFVPIVFGIARRANISPSKLLLPLAFSAILTSNGGPSSGHPERSSAVVRRGRNAAEGPRGITSDIDSVSLYVIGSGVPHWARRQCGTESNTRSSVWRSSNYASQSSRPSQRFATNDVFRKASFGTVAGNSTGPFDFVPAHVSTRNCAQGDRTHWRTFSDLRHLRIIIR